jgi:Putative porin
MKAGKKCRSMSSISIMIIMMIPFTGLLSAQTGAPAPKKSTASAKSSVTVKEVQDLKEAVAAQQQQIRQQNQMVDQLKSQLQQLIDATQQANAAAQKASTGIDQAQSTAALAQQSAAQAKTAADQAASNAAAVQSALAVVNTTTQDERKQLSALESLVGRFRFSGDVRVRGESYFQQGVPDDNLARIRVRFGIDGQLNEDFTAGIALASGALGNPTSANETLTNEFDRKTIALDRGYITYNPIAHHWLSLTGGKFAYTWQRTSATFDPDINPEGFDEKASFNFAGPLQNFTIQGIELLYNQANGKPGIPSQDSYTLGMQVSGRLQFGFWTTTPSFLSLKWNRPDAILQASAFGVGATTTGFQPPTPTGGPTPAPITGIPVPGEGQGCAKGTGLPSYSPCVFAPNGMTNATYVDSKGVPHFYSGYNYADLIINNQFQTPLPRLPVNVLVEFLDNLDAEAHPLGTKGQVLTNLGSQNKEYGFDANVGQLKNKNDFQIGYSWYREEQDAALASFVESDQRAPTNILQNRFYALWKLRANTVAGFTWWHGRALNTYLENNVALFNNYNSGVPTIAKAGEQEPYLNRLQFDLIYTY